MKIKLIIILLVLLPLLGCAATPQKQEQTMDAIPQQFLGYWEPVEPWVESGLLIHPNWRINQVEKRDGYLLNRFVYKLIDSPDPDTLYMMMKSLDFPGVFLYTKLVFKNVDVKNLNCVFLDEYLFVSADPKDWKNFNQTKEILKVKDMISDKSVMERFSPSEYQKCLY